MAQRLEELALFALPELVITEKEDDERGPQEPTALEPAPPGQTFAEEPKLSAPAQSRLDPTETLKKLVPRIMDIERLRFSQQEESDDERRRRHDPDDLRRARKKARQYLASHRTKKVVEVLEDIRQEEEKRHHSNDLGRLQTQRDLAMAYYLDGSRHEAMRLLEKNRYKVLGEVGKTLGSPNFVLLTELPVDGVLRRWPTGRRNRYSECNNQRCRGPQPTIQCQFLIALGNLGMIYYHNHQIEAAIKALKRTLHKKRKVYPKGDQRLISPYLQLAMAYFRNGQPNEAAKKLRNMLPEDQAGQSSEEKGKGLASLADDRAVKPKVAAGYNKMDLVQEILGALEELDSSRARSNE